MMTKAIIDSNILIALFDKKDALHPAVKRLLPLLQENFEEVILLDCVINEVLNALARRSHERSKGNSDLKVLHTFLESIEKYPIEWSYALVPDNWHKIIAKILHSNGTLNFHDCLILLTMEDLEMATLITADRDFKNVAGLQVISP